MFTELLLCEKMLFLIILNGSNRLTSYNYHKLKINKRKKTPQMQPSPLEPN